MLTAILSCYSHNQTFSSYTNEEGSQIISFHSDAFAKLLPVLKEMLASEIAEEKRREGEKEKSTGIPLRPLQEVLGIRFYTDFAVRVLEQHAAKLLSENNIELLVGSTEKYPCDIHIYARKKGASIVWVDDGEDD